MPSLIKELMHTELSAIVAKAPAIILVDASRLNAADAIALRVKLRGAGARLRVGKASVIYRALPAAVATASPPGGPLGLVLTGEDIAAAAKIINDLVKEEKAVLKGGLMEGRAIDAKAAKSLADLPTREQANAMLVRVLVSPLVQLVRIANAKPTELVRVLKVKSSEGAA